MPKVRLPALLKCTSHKAKAKSKH